MTTARDVLAAYLAAQSTGDVNAVLRLVAPDAVFDVGRGRYEGEQVPGFLHRLADVHSVTTLAAVTYQDATRVSAILDQHDDDLLPPRDPGHSAGPRSTRR